MTLFLIRSTNTPETNHQQTPFPEGHNIGIRHEIMDMGDKIDYTSTPQTPGDKALRKVQENQRELIIRALNLNSGNKIAAAATLGITVEELARQLKRHGL